MTDEIDIEEHDIMGNNIFPDISAIKKEIDNYYDNEFESTEELLKKHDKLYQDMKPDHENECIEETISTASDTADSLDDIEAPQSKLLQCNKIILGSKPNKIAVDGDYFEECVKPYQANVVLQDINSYLQKSKRYCEDCGILFPEPSDYVNHLQLCHPQKYLKDPSQNKIVVKRIYKHKCNVCAKMFGSNFELRRHMEKSHNLNPVNNNETIENNNDSKNQQIFESSNSDLSNTCFHCKETFETQKSLIDHLYDILQTKRKTTEIIPVLKSVLFRCNKCDIYFVSCQVAANHTDHMEMLINWKCSICFRIFKKEDELSHERQHSVSNNFMIYNLEEVDINKILFKCSKCGTHFSEINFLYHFRDCSLKALKRACCSICNISLDSDIKKIHESGHKSTDLNINNLTIIETEVISDNPVKTAMKGLPIANKLNEVVETFREVKVVLQRLDVLKSKQCSSSSIDEHFSHKEQIQSDSNQKIEVVKSTRLGAVCYKKNKCDKQNTRNKIIKKRNHEDRFNEISEHDKIIHPKGLTGMKSISTHFQRLNSAYFYCDDCKCFIPKRGSAKHIQSRCINLKKLACKYCGLMLTMTSFRTHKKLHEKCSDLKLRNFKFFNLRNGQLISPPIPEYPQCDICGVHFLSKAARINHVCSEEAYLTCHICIMKLSEAAFKLHMMFHHYSLKDNLVVTSNYVQSKIDLNNKTNVNLPVENGMKLQKPIQYTCEMPIQNNHNPEIIYTCRNCTITVHTYDKVVEHCHGHYNSEEKDVDTKKCCLCSLQIDKTCYTEHQNLHEKGITFKILKFDSFYFPVENDMWVKHVFKSIPTEQILEILSKSIYRFEGRIKMEVVQEGEPELTVYKCDQCTCFIEPTSLFKHADNSCFKLRKHPCTICDLPFLSSASRMDHEKIHKRPGITSKSYRIVVFNREQDKQLNSSFCFRKRYLLYQCRNCGGIIDKLHSDTHKCNISDLTKCPDCHLLLYKKEFEAHAAEHKEFASFNYRNMKVILYGEVKNVHTTGEQVLNSKYQGTIYDYKMYRCNKCHICIKNEKFIPKHSCYFGKPHSKCPKCDLYFSVSRLKTHLRCHERDPDFLRSNMTIVSFDPYLWDQNKNTTAQIETGDSEVTDSYSDSDSDIVLNAEEKKNYYNGESCDTKDIVEETTKVYKCSCGLHFLNEDSITRHFGVCRSKIKISNQKCPKCDLLFTPNVLFTHLLAHHSNRNRRYKYDIIERLTTEKT